MDFPVVGFQPVFALASTGFLPIITLQWGFAKKMADSSQFIPLQILVTTHMMHIMDDCHKVFKGRLCFLHCHKNNTKIFFCDPKADLIWSTVFWIRYAFLWILGKVICFSEKNFAEFSLICLFRLEFLKSRKEYLPNLLENWLLPRFFVFWVRDFKFWLSTCLFFYFLYLCKVSERLANFYISHFTRVPPLNFW